MVNEKEKNLAVTNENKVEVVFTVDDAIEHFGFGKFQILISLFAGLSWVNIFESIKWD